MQYVFPEPDFPKNRTTGVLIELTILSVLKPKILFKKLCHKKPF
jgi:hypothetical protein